MEVMKNTDEELRELLKLLKTEKKSFDEWERWEKQKRVLTLLAAGSVLAFSMVAPGAARLGKYFRFNSDEDDWRVFNSRYLRGALKSLEKQKFVEFTEENGVKKVILTEKGKRRVLEFNIDKMSIGKPSVWDGKWRIVFYDVSKNKNRVRDRFRNFLKSLGFYQFQESVYLHAYPCEKEVEFLRNYLGVGGSVRLVVAEEIESDEVFKKYFGV